MHLDQRLFVTCVERGVGADVEPTTLSKRALAADVADQLCAAVYRDAIDAAGVMRVDLHLGDSDHSPRTHESSPGVFELHCALEWTAVLGQRAPVQRYVMVALAHTMLGQIPVLGDTVWPRVALPIDVDGDTMNAIVSVAVAAHLSPEERQQLILFPTSDKIHHHLDQYPEAKGRVQTLGIDRDTMSVDVFWAGEQFDPHTQDVFTRLSRLTGVPIRLAPVLLTVQEVMALQDRIMAEQEDAQTVGNDVHTDTMEVGVSGSLEGRPGTIDHNGKTVPIRYHHSDVQPATAGGRRHHPSSRGCSSSTPGR